MKSCPCLLFQSGPAGNPSQQTTSYSLRGRTGRERLDIESDVDEGGTRAQADTDIEAHDTDLYQHQTVTRTHPPVTRHSPQQTPLQTTHTAGNLHTAGDRHQPED